MSSISRSIRNVFRNKARTLIVTLIVGFAIGVFLSMSIVNANISSNTISLSEDLETTIMIRPAGSFGFISTETMNESILTDIGSVEHISSIQMLIIRAEMDESSGLMPGKREFTSVQGLDPGQNMILFVGGSITITDGRTLDSSDTNEPVAIIGSGYSDSTGANVGDIVYLNGTAVNVVGEFTSGTTVGDRTVIIPYEIAKDAYNVTGMNIIYVTIDTIGNMGIVEDTLKNLLGSEYDVVPYSSVIGDRAASLQENIDTISANSELGSVISLITAAAVMVFIMILVTRERTKEIGVLKAIGFRNSRIVTQFFAESMVLASLGFIVGIIFTIIAGPYVANIFLGTSANSAATGFMGADSQNLLATIDFTLNVELIAYTLILAIVLGIIGSLYPIIRAIKLKPAEALRYDE